VPQARWHDMESDKIQQCLFSNKPKAIVLGGTSPHIELINALKRRGYYTVLIDYYPNPPAKEVSDEHFQESTMDKEKALEIAKAIDAKLVISAAVDQVNITACYVAEKLNLPRPYSYQTALNICNKGFMKKVMVEAGVPTSRYVYINNKADLDKIDLTYPLMVKPADLNSSNGVRKVYSRSELDIYVTEALKLSRSGNAVVEEYKEGLEINAYCFIKEKEVYLLTTTQRKTLIEGDVIKCYAALYPAEISNVTKEIIRQVSIKIVNAFNLDNTPFFIQAIVSDNIINIIEFAPRIGGGLSCRIIKYSTGFDIIESAIDSYLGVPVNIGYNKPKKLYVIDTLYAMPGIFDYIEGAENLIKNKIIKGYYPYKTKGMVIGTGSSSGRVGAFIVEADSRQELLEKTKQAMEVLEVYDINGKPVLRKDLYLQNC
jgi:biotin carboxylase